jgi:hypothetical protein
MSLPARARWTRLAAALLTAVALLPALHDASSHQAPLAGDGASVASAAHEAGALATELCPICLAGHTAAAVMGAPDTSPAPILAAIARLPETPLLPARAAFGAAGPRAPPAA